MHTNASALGFLAFVGLVLAVLGGGVVLLAGLVARRWTLVLTTLGLGLIALTGYGAALAGVALASRDVVLGAGQEKHICEVDCHVAYAVTGVRTARALGADGRSATAGGTFYVVTVRVRFDPTTTSPRRPMDVPVYPGLRRVLVVDGRGRTFAPSAAGAVALAATDGAPASLSQPLLPAASYTTTLVFDLPADVRGPRLLIADADPTKAMVVGHENSPLHGRTYFELRDGSWVVGDR
ncbi:MAG: hypothetical protein AAB409_01315 [Gemmatimonadota bacterium]